MQTFKTAVVVILLLALLYGVYVVLSKPEAQEAASHLARELVSSSRSPESPPQDSLDNPWVSMPPTFGSQGPLEMSGETPDPAFGGPAGMAPERSGPSAADSHSSPQPAGGPTRDILPATAESPVYPPAAGSRPWRDSPTDMSAGPGSPTSPGSGGPASDGAPRNHASPSAPTADPSVPGGSAPSPEGQQSPTTDSATAARGASRQLGSQAFAKAMRTARTAISEGQLREALYTLSIFYHSPDLTQDEHRQLLDLLDPLAGHVVYSSEHLLEEPYEVRRNETLFDIAERYQVPWQLLQNINGVRDPQVLVPGTKLKVVPGPFRAEVSQERSELTLFVGRLYAGRFPVTFGSDPAPAAGSYEVRDKRSDRAYYGSDGRVIPADDIHNPYGGIWLDLGQELSIHGSPGSRGPVAERLGCISLSPRDARDVYGILSLGSQVVIRR